MMVDFVRLMDPKTLRPDKAEQFFDDPDWLMEPKINGRRIQSGTINNEVGFAGRYAREGSENIDDFKYKFRNIRNDLQEMLPNGTLLDGEVHLPGRPSSQTFQIVNASSIDTAISLQEQYGFLVYVVFDIMFYDGQSLLSSSLNFRRRKLRSIISQTCNVELVENIQTTVDKKRRWSEILDSSNEEKGVVFKFAESDYDCSRSKWWRKLKRFETYDGVITGFNLDKKYPTDFVSSIQVAQYRNTRLVHVANVSNLTKDQASEFRSHIDVYIGKVIQFKAEAKTPTSYKNPRFDRVRPDKEPQSCVW